MIIIHRILAQRYAAAFLNRYDAHITDHTISQLHLFQRFLNNNKSILVYLSIPSINEKIKHSAIEKIAIHFKITFLANLIKLLLRHKRISLLPLVINHSIILHHKRHNIALFSINTSHTLQENEKERIITFIHNNLGQKKIQTHFSVRPELICGLRIKSDTMLWERSIKKVLQLTKQSLFQRVGL